MVSLARLADFGLATEPRLSTVAHGLEAHATSDQCESPGVTCFVACSSATSSCCISAWWDSNSCITSGGFSGTMRMPAIAFSYRRMANCFSSTSLGSRNFSDRNARYCSSGRNPPRHGHAAE